MYGLKIGFYLTVELWETTAYSLSRIISLGGSRESGRMKARRLWKFADNYSAACTLLASSRWETFHSARILQELRPVGRPANVVRRDAFPTYSSL